MNPKEQYERGREFLLNLEGEVCIIYHKDSDGVSSAVQLYKFLSENDKEVIMVSPNDGPGLYMTGELIDQMKKCDNVIFLDIPLDQTSVPEKLDSNILVLDHHPITEDLNGRNILHLNPRFHDSNIYHPASHFIYRMLNKKKYLWIAAIGVVGDYGADDCEEFMKELKDEYPELVEEGISQKEAMDSRIGLYPKMIAAAKGIDGLDGIKRSFWLILNSGEHGDLMDTQLVEYYNEFQRELGRLVKDFEENTIHYPESNSYIYEVESEYAITSSLINKVSHQNEDAMIFFFNETDENIKVSCRCQSGRVHMGEFIRELAEGIGTAGGHEKAAAAGIDVDERDEFLDRLMDRLKDDSL